MTGTVVPLSTDPPALLGPGDPPPFEVVNARGRAGIVLVCDHASWTVPAALHGLGLDEAVLRRHIGWDIGAGDVTRRLAGLLDAPAVLAGYSRLVIDCNRPLGAPTSIPALSDRVAVPANQGLDGSAARARAVACFTPYHQAIDEVVSGVTARSGPPVLVSMHSFTPVLDGFERPWHVGVLWHRDGRVALPLIVALRADPTMRVGDNEPYSGRAPIPYCVPAHAEATGLPHATVEIRQDLIDTHHGAEAWANRMAAALRQVLADPAIHRPSISAPAEG